MKKPSKQEEPPAPKRKATEHPADLAIITVCNAMGIPVVEAADYCNGPDITPFKMLCALTMRTIGVHDSEIIYLINGISDVKATIEDCNHRASYDYQFERHLLKATSITNALLMEFDFSDFFKLENLISLLKASPVLEGEDGKYRLNNVKKQDTGFGFIAIATSDFRNHYSEFKSDKPAESGDTIWQYDILPEFNSLYPPAQYFLLRALYHFSKKRVTHPRDCALPMRLAFIDCYRKGVNLVKLLSMYETAAIHYGHFSPAYETALIGLWKLMLTLPEYNHSVTRSADSLNFDFQQSIYTTSVVDNIDSETLNEEDMPSCAICHHPLTDKDSVRRGIGPDCWAKMQAEVEKASQDYPMDLVPYKEGDDIFVERLPDGSKRTNVRRSIVKHSTTDYEWGYTGSGPAELALNALMMFCDYRTAYNLHQVFKEQFIAGIPVGGGKIPYYDVQQFIAEQTRDLFKQK